LTLRAGQEAIGKFDSQLATSSGVKVLARSDVPDKPQFMFGLGD
jgi:hypothetical protein